MSNNCIYTNKNNMGSCKSKQVEPVIEVVKIDHDHDRLPTHRPLLKRQNGYEVYDLFDPNTASLLTQHYFTNNDNFKKLNELK